MSDQQDQQLFQIQNILETLLEATDHFSKLVQQRDFPQSVYTFTSITEGAGAVAHSLIELNKDFTDHTDKLASILVKIKTEGAGQVAHSTIEINKDFNDHTDKLASILVKIKNQLEDNNLPGIPSSLTDSLSQEFKHILKKFQEAYGNQK